MKNSIICFKGDTLISTVKGVKKISEIVVGDKIITYNQNLKNIESTIVNRTAFSIHNKIIKLSFEDATHLTMTVDHPLWIINKGWSALKPNKIYNLKQDTFTIGDLCLFIDKSHTLKTKMITNVVYLSGSFKMHIISAGNHHNFFANGILVHDENLEKLELEKYNLIYEEL